MTSAEPLLCVAACGHRALVLYRTFWVHFFLLQEPTTKRKFIRAARPQFSRGPGSPKSSLKKEVVRLDTTFLPKFCPPKSGGQHGHPPLCVWACPPWEIGPAPCPAKRHVQLFRAKRGDAKVGARPVVPALNTFCLRQQGRGRYCRVQK